MTEVRKELAVQLSRKIYNKNVSRKELADKSGISRATIVNILDGKHSVTLENFLSICEALDISPQKFLRDVLDYRKLTLEISAAELPNKNHRQLVNTMVKKYYTGDIDE